MSGLKELLRSQDAELKQLRLQLSIGDQVRKETRAED